jgi:hypothetical protein
MSHQRVFATFAHEVHFLAATEAVRKKGLTIVDAFTPYAVHGLDRAMGLKPSRLTWVCFACGMFGFLSMLWFEHWTASISWPIDVGGKPWNSLPSDIPVAFEAAVLLAGFGSVFALFFVSGLYPGKEERQIFPGSSDDLFVMVIESIDAESNIESIERLLVPFNYVTVTECFTSQG